MRLRVPYDRSGKRLHFHGISPAMNGALSRQIPAQRFGEPGKVATAVALLAANDAASIAGAELAAAGGRARL